jgi:NTE family protein
MTKRALVLSGGGHVGIGWEVGVLAGLAQAGADACQADFILGTSAGAVVGAQIADGTDPAELAAVLRREDRGPSGAVPDLSGFFAKILQASTGARPATEIYAEMGADALKAKTMSEETCIAMVGQMFGVASNDAWPQRDFACTAFNAENGEFQVWNRDSGVGLARAVASSCVMPGVFPPITLGGGRYFEGGLQSRTSAHLAAGYERVLIIALRVSEAASALNHQVSAHYTAQTEIEVETLRSGGAMTLMITPDALSLAAFGPNLMDASRRAGAVDEGVRQGRGQARLVAEFWN